MSGSWASSPGNFTVDKVAYDQNGNITDLKRYGEQDERQYLWDNLEYQYDGNRLRAVGELAEGQAEVGFVDGVAGSATVEYGYDQNGNMTRDDNKGISSITYDPVLNLPTEVVITGKGTIKYTYDAAGTKLRQEVLPSDGSPSKTTDYVGGFHYTDGTLDFVQHDEGRLMIQDGLAYHYDLKDHLGNTRVTFSNVPVTTTAQATMEASAAPVEEAVFEGVAESRQTLAFHNTTTASSEEPQPNKVATLQPGAQGPAKSVAVHAGDTVRLKVNARYETVPSQVQGLEGIATEVVGAASRSAAGLESSGAITGTNWLAAGSALTNGKEPDVPQAYLNYLLYDENYQLINQGFQQVSEAAAVGKANPSAAPEALELEVPVQEEGFLYTYLSNELGAGSSSSLVYFDDFTVEQLSYIMQVDDYYPFGLTHDQSSGRVHENKYLYNGKEIQDELGLSLYDYGARMYDAALGRWHVVDPLADQFAGWSPYNFVMGNPILNIDPDGAAPLDIITTIAAINQQSSLYQKRDVSVKVTLTVVNSSNLDLSNTMFASGSGTINAMNTFGGSGEARTPSLQGDGQKTDTDFNITGFDIEYNVVSSLDDVGENDHVMMIVNSIPDGVDYDNDGNLDNPLGLASGRVSAVEAGTIGTGKFDETALHELGHNLSLGHTDNGKGLMGATINGQMGVGTKERGGMMTSQGAHLKAVGTYKQSSSYTTNSKDEANKFMQRNSIVQ